MSGAHASVVSLSDEKARRGRVLRPGQGRHRRTPEAWAQAEAEREELRTVNAELVDKNDRLKDTAERFRVKAKQFADAGGALQKERDALAEEVRRLRALLGPDADNPANQATHSFKMVERPAEPMEITTQPISVKDLFPDQPPRSIRSAPSARPPIPAVTVHPDPRGIPPMPSFKPTVPAALLPTPVPVPDAAARLVARFSTDNLEKVQSTTEHQLMALWDTPMAQVPPDARRTA